MLFDAIVLTSYAKFHGSRSVSAVYHLLTGKRSIQTVQDAHIYQLNDFYGIYPTLQKQAFDEHIHRLSELNLLTFTNQNAGLPTSKGKHRMEQQDTYGPIQYFKGLLYHRKASVFWERLLLLIQTMTNSKVNHFHFIPIIDKPVVADWVKTQYLKWKNHRTCFLNQLYDELFRLLQLFPEREASIVVDSLTSYNHYGMNSFQLANHYSLKQIDIPLIRMAIMHQMLTVINQNTKAYPFLAQMVYELPQTTPLTNSASKTREYLDRHYSAEEIAEMRQLKLNTIYDHMVEIALYDQTFPLEHYVTPTEQAEIRAAIDKTVSFKLKNIKQEVSETISYFQIRLVLAVEKIS
ncbi:helix-turn-helix domain-containing protein [Lentibacillus salinarum]|uniref:Helix-turn-helix domain-containing protein n=1 Tax=Lentibacillus salinarum TaxID=446820 RepID=A0ABW3ZS04_9BACI